MMIRRKFVTIFPIDQMNVHKSKCHGKMKEKLLLPCPKCPQMMTQKSIANHDKAHHDDSLPYSCDKCSYRALSHHAIAYHKGRYHNPNMKPCSLGCGKSFTGTVFRKRHEKRYCVNSKIKESLIAIEKMDGTLEKESQRVKRQHAKNQTRFNRFEAHGPAALTAFSCELCDFADSTDEGIKAHMVNHHGNDTKSGQKRKIGRPSNEGPKKKQVQNKTPNWGLPSPCPKCPYFGTNVKLHLQEHHDPNLPFGCEYCDFRGHTANTVKIHSNKYHPKPGAKRYVCSLGCGKTFSGSWSERMHARRYCELSTEKEELMKRELADGTYEKQRMEVKARQIRKKTEIRKYTLGQEKNL